MDGKYPKVEIRFFSDEGEEILMGTVLIRSEGREMVIDIQDPDAADHYLIGGLRVDHCYHGKNEHHDAKARLQAKWGEIDGIYVGVWVEDADEYLFCFTLPISA